MSVTCLHLWLVDSFSSLSFRGNPAFVTIVDDFLEDSLMQSIASELNCSETCFVKPRENHRYQIRWFSPLDEAPMCGHATLAAAHVLWENKICSADYIVFESKAGILGVWRTSDGWIQMNFPSVEVEPCSLLKDLKDGLGDVSIESVYRDHLICLVMLSGYKELVGLKPNFQKIAKLPYRAVTVTSEGFGEYDFISRYFAPKVGILEDPVCGSAHCRLGPFWSKMLNKNHLFAYQASRRGGTLKLNINDDRTLISGKAVTVCEGDFNLSQKLIL